MGGRILVKRKRGEKKNIVRQERNFFLKKRGLRVDFDKR